LEIISVHEKIIQGVTIGVVAGLIVYWFTSRNETKGFQSAKQNAYMPTVGDVRNMKGMGTAACCQCCGLPAPDNSTIPLATDYLDCAPVYAPPTSNWNIGISMQLGHEKIEGGPVNYREVGSTKPYGVSGPNTVPIPITIQQPISCNPDVPIQIKCTEVV
jgi:hypothetical protein